jgi:N-methylhydantoinase B
MSEAADPTTELVLGNAFTGIAEEMAAVEYRSSFSPIIREMLDFSCALFHLDGRMVSNSAQIPAQLGLMTFALAETRRVFGNGFEEGDVLLCNHPYRGGTHTPDLQIFTPIHFDGAVIGYAGSIAHHIDVGGRVPGTESGDNTEVFQEGLLFPPVKLYEGGVPSRSLHDLIGANVRDPASTLGDLSAQVAACRRAEARMHDLCRRHSPGSIVAAMDALLERTAQRTRDELSRWPSRKVVAEGYLDGDAYTPDQPIRIVAAIEPRNGRLLVDLTGSDPQVRGGINVPWSSTHAAVYFAVRAFLGSAISHNDGMTQQIDVIAEEGTILRPRPPAAVGARHLTVQRLADVLCRALGQLIPERAVASSNVSFPNFVLQAIDDRTGRLTLLTDVVGGGSGARRDAPGDHAIDAYTSNCALLPTEVAEMEYPWRILKTELVPGSGGAGTHPGGMAMRREYELLADAADGMYEIEQTVAAFGAEGLAGGGPGAPARIAVRRRATGVEEVIPGKGTVRLSRGDVLTIVSSGGGGYGSPDGSDVGAEDTA